MPNSGPMKMAARFSVPDAVPSRYRPSAQTRSPGQGVIDEKVILSSLCACCTPAVLRFSRIIWTKSCSSPFFDFELIDQFVVLVHCQHAVRGEALDRERPGDADLSLVLVGLVVEVFEVGLGGDGGVDFLLAGDALLPPFGVQLLCLLGPFVVSLARNFPLFPLLLERRVELLAQRFQRRSGTSPRSRRSRRCWRWT